MSQVNWTCEERESLYHSAIDHINDLAGSGVISPDDQVITDILSNSKVNRDNKSIVFKLCEMGFLHGTGSKAFRKDVETLDIHGFGVHPVYKKLKADEEKAAKAVLNSHWNSSSDPHQLIAALAEELKISSTHAHCWLMKNGNVLLENPSMAEDEAPRYVLAVNPFDNQSPEEFKLKRIPDSVKLAINGLRSKVAGLYDSYTKPNPSIVRSNDGTGTGKSYSVLDQFVDNTNPDGSGRGHRNLVFITPQKAQIKFAPFTISKAEAKGIPFLGFYSREDACNLDFKHWVTEKTTESLFADWIKGLRANSRFKDLMSEFEGSIQGLKHCMGSLDRLERDKDKDKISLDRLLEDKSRMQGNIRRLLKQMATTAMNDPKVDQARGGNHYFTSENKTDILIAGILDHVVPLERAKYQPCVLMSTTDKFIHTTPVFKKTKEGFSLVDIPFDYVIGQKVRKDLSDGLKDANGQPFDEQIRYIRDEFFEQDTDNYYLKHDISFTLIVDEVHIAHDKILSARHKTLFDPTIKIPHVLNAVYRIINRVKHTESGANGRMVLQDTFKAFHDDLTYLFENRCNSKFKVEQILSMFQANLGDMSIDGRDVEQVIGICKNVFSVTPKRYFNENALKKIRFRSLGNDSECRIYFTDTAEGDGSDSNPSMHDLMQITLCVFAACAQLKDDKMTKWFSHNSVNNQNSLLTQFIKIAKRNRASVDSMFCRIEDENLNVDEIFTYFTPKIVFSIEKIDDLPLSPADLDDAIHVGFQVELFEELPEVSVMRLLHNTKNTVITLSATSGFHGSYCGDYAQDVLCKFGESTHNQNLGFKSIIRSAADIQTLTDLRDARSALRKIEFSSFADNRSGRVSSLSRGKDFEETFAVWCKPFLASLQGSNKYRVMELKRNIESLLMAAYDGKNTLALSLTNSFSRTFRDYLKKTSSPLGKPKFPEKNCDKILDITPFNNGITLRVILFDADLNKLVDIDKLVKTDSNTKVAFFSSYKTAGTGLNLFTTDTAEDLQQDFERLILVNSPFYSTVMTPDGIHTALNYILALKHYASSGGMTVLSFDQMLKSPEFKRRMMAEHRLAILKDIMQAIGRIERRDTHITSQIFLPDTLLEDISLQFSIINTPDNAMLIKSMSMLNQSLMEYCLAQMHQKSFATEDERTTFRTTIAHDGSQIEYFMDTFLRKRVLKDARAGDLESAELNELLRHLDCVRDPQRFMDRIKNHKLVKAIGFEDIVDKFYIKMAEGQEHIKLCWPKKLEPGLTDYSAGSQIYRPYETIIPEYTKTLSNSKGDTTTGLMNRLWDMNKDDKALPLPNPAMIPLLKGNVGEDLFKSFMAQFGLQPMSVKDLFEQLSPRAYELFDSFIQKENRLFCVDVKNWSSKIENGEMSAELVSKSAGKRKTLMDICTAAGLEPSFIYVNAHYDRNARNTMQEFTKGEPIHYMNLFKVGTHYKASTKFRQGSKIQDTMEFNRSLITLLTN